MPYVNPGDAASSAIDDMMMQRAAAKRQAMLDQLAIQRETDAHQQGQAALAEKKAESLARIEEKERGDTEKDVNNMVIGDIPDPDLVARAKKYHVPLRTVTPPGAGTALPPAAPMPTPPGGGAATPPPTGAPALPTAQPMPMRFGGTQAQVVKQQQEGDIQKLIDSLPAGSPERKRLEEERVTGRAVPAGAYRDAASMNVPVMTREQALKAGTIPKDTKIEEPLQPKDQSAKTDREAAHRDQVHQTAIVELDKMAKPIEDQISSLNNLGVSLAQKNNPKADALIAAELLKGTIAGSGVRITQPEITQVLGGSRTKWDSLSVKLNAWGGDPTAPLVLTDEEKSEIRDLTKALRAKANAQHQKVTKARHAMDDAEDVPSLNRIRTKLQEDLYATDEPVDTAPVLAAPSGAPVATHRYNLKTGKIEAVTP